MPDPVTPDLTDSGPEEPVDVVRPDASQLQDRVPPWAQLSRQTVIWTFLLGLWWLFLSYQPLWHTDLWGHLAYGRVIVERGSIPATEPLLPLAQGVPLRDTAWLSQLIGYGMYSIQGVTGLRFLFAAMIITATVTMLIRFRERSDSIALPLLGLVVMFGFAWKSLFIIRPQIGGLVCYAILLALVTKRRWHPAEWVVIPGIFVIWANLHGSFPIGLGLLGLLAVGRGIDVGLRTGNWRHALADRRFRRLTLLTELALVATLLNPLGIGVYSAIDAISNSPNLRSLVEWEPITLRMTHGKTFAISVILLLFAYRLSPRRVSAGEVLLLIGYGLAALWSVRMMVWWTPLAAWFLVLHGRAILNQREQRRVAASLRKSTAVEADVAADPDEEEAVSLLRPRSGLNTVLVGGMLWIFFAYTPFGATVLHGYPKDPDEARKFYRNNLSRDTPVDLTNYLIEHPPRGLVFNSYEWGDYLLWAGPEGMPIFLNSHAHLLPREVWEDYFTIAQARSGWEDKLDRYGINTIVVDFKYRSGVIELLTSHPDWQLDYKDPQGAIFLRKVPILNQPMQLELGARR